MPRYAYHCRDCNLDFEQDSPIALRDRVRCPKCKGRNPRIVVAAVSRVWKCEK